MLHELRIENLLLIERAELRLGEGLNAITGETGAGKTILAHSLDLLMGGKARPQIVRPGAEEAYVEGVFALPDGLLDDPELAEIARAPARGRRRDRARPPRRRLGAHERVRRRPLGVGGGPARARLAAARLLRTARAPQADPGLGAARDPRRVRRPASRAPPRYREAHAEVAAIDRELAELREREGARERDLDLLRFELEEIEAARPDPGEEAELAAERDRLRHAESLRAAAGGALGALSGPTTTAAGPLACRGRGPAGRR